MTETAGTDSVAFGDQLDAAARQTFERFLYSAGQRGQTPYHNPKLVGLVVEALRSRSMEACPHVPDSPTAVMASLWNSRLECTPCSANNPPPRSHPLSVCTICNRPSPKRLGLAVVPWSFVTIFALICVDCAEVYR